MIRETNTSNYKQLLSFHIKKGEGHSRYHCSTQKHISADLVEVAERRAHGVPVASLVVLEAVLLEELLDARRDHRVAELRHAGEQMVLDLEVQVAHPPVDELERVGIDFH